MAAEGKLYTILYNDGVMLHYRFTDEEYNELCSSIEYNRKCIRLSVGLLVLIDIRAVNLQREIEATENEAGSPELTQEEKEYLAVLRHSDRLAREERIEDDDDVDYTGGMITDG